MERTRFVPSINSTVHIHEENNACGTEATWLSHRPTSELGDSRHGIGHDKPTCLTHCRLSSSDLSFNRPHSRSLHDWQLVLVSEGMAPIRTNRIRSSRRAWA
jgi:hypothetical protein